MDSKVELGKPHAVCIPFPAQGHINPMLKLAKLLNHKGFHISFVNTEYNHRRLLKSRGSNSLDGLPSFKFETIPDGLPPSDADATQDVPSLCYSTSTTCLSPLGDLITRLNNSGNSSNVPPVTCIVTDGVMSFALEAAEEFGIPGVLFWTTSACGFYGYLQYATLVQMGYIPLKDAGYLTNGYLDTILNGIPGMAGIRLRDLPSFLRTTSMNDIMLNFVLAETARARRASAVVFNTFENLEHDILKALSSIQTPVYAIGPLQYLEKQGNDTATALDMLGSNLWKEEPECLEWLDSKEEKSVVYVNFGSAALMTSKQLMEFAWGLANSKQTFLWVIRPDIVSGGEAISLPPEFLDEVKGRGFLSGWCAQEKVLNHPSVGGFLTHNGWNSNLESICSWVAMICWPFFAEQQTNCWYSCGKWGIGMEIDNNVKRDEVTSLVLELMVGEKGKEMKGKAAGWKKLALEAAKSSSYHNLDKVINQVLLSR